MHINQIKTNLLLLCISRSGIFTQIWLICKGQKRSKRLKKAWLYPVLQNITFMITIEHILFPNLAWKVYFWGCQMGLYHPWEMELSFARPQIPDFLNDFFWSLWGYTKALWWNFGWEPEIVQALAADHCVLNPSNCMVWEASIWNTLRLLRE